MTEDLDSEVARIRDLGATYERLVDCDDEERRLVYSIIGDTVVPDHDNAVFQVHGNGESGSQFVWTHDVLPSALAEAWAPGMDRGMELLKHVLEHKSERSPTVYG